MCEIVQFTLSAYVSECAVYSKCAHV